MVTAETISTIVLGSAMLDLLEKSWTLMKTVCRRHQLRCVLLAKQGPILIWVIPHAHPVLLASIRPWLARPLLTRANGVRLENTQRSCLLCWKLCARAVRLEPIKAIQVVQPVPPVQKIRMALPLDKSAKTNVSHAVPLILLQEIELGWNLRLPAFVMKTITE